MIISALEAITLVFPALVVAVALAVLYVLRRARASSAAQLVRLQNND